MALRALVGKLRRGPSTADAASRVLATCEHCGKPSSRIEGSLGLGRKDGAVKIDPSEELRRYKWRHYKIRTVAAVTGLRVRLVRERGGIEWLHPVFLEWNGSK